MNHDVSIIALGILYHSHDRPHEDEDADQVKREHVLLPRCSMALRSGMLADACVEDGCCDDEETKHDDLDDETAYYDVVAHVDAVDVATG